MATLLNHSILKRAFFVDDSDSGWNQYGRWIMFAIIVGVSIIAFLYLRFTATRRVRYGRTPIWGTSWMVPPSYYQATQQNPNDAVPMYRQKAGVGDAGHYDPEGNFVPVDANVLNPGRTFHYSQSQQPVTPGASIDPRAAAYYPPPSGPPPNQQSDMKTSTISTYPV